MKIIFTHLKTVSAKKIILSVHHNVTDIHSPIKITTNCRCLHSHYTVLLLMVQYARSNSRLKTINMTDLNRHLKKRYGSRCRPIILARSLASYSPFKKSRDLHQFMTFIMHLNATSIQLWHVYVMEKARNVIFQFFQRV